MDHCSSLEIPLPSRSGILSLHADTWAALCVIAPLPHHSMQHTLSPLYAVFVPFRCDALPGRFAFSPFPPLVWSAAVAAHHIGSLPPAQVAAEMMMMMMMMMMKMMMMM